MMSFKSFKNDLGKSLTFAYITAFALIAILTVASHLVTNYIMTKQKESAELSYNLGRQRGLLEQVSYYSKGFYNQGDKIDLNLLLKAIDDVESSHNDIIKSIKNPQTMGDVIGESIGGSVGKALGQGIKSLTGSEVNADNSILFKIYYTPPYVFNDSINNFVEKARWFAEFPAHSKGPSRRQAFEAISSKRIEPVLLSLDIALEGYQSETVQKIVGFYNLQTLSAAIILLVLLIEASFIFRPLVRRINRYHKILLRQALEDPLTGLDNRRAFNNKADAEIRRSIRHQAPMVAVLTDLDKFKLVNDNYGHDVGDLVLKHFAKILKQSLREIDVIGRIGGEEFALILTGTNHEKGMQILERLRDKVEKTPCRYTNPKDGTPAMLRYTVSIGCYSIIAKPGDTIEHYLKKSDEVLYKAKDTGRNKVIMTRGYEEEPDPESKTEGQGKNNKTPAQGKPSKKA